jgi:RimJ/RimL family protein N-acetyltransferase
VIKAVTDEIWRKRIFEYVKPKAHITTNLDNKFSFIGFVENDNIFGGLIFSDYDGYNIFVHLALETPRVCQRRFIKMMFSYCFIQLKCSRMTAMCVNGYTRNEKLLKGVGFTKEGVIRKVMKVKDKFVDSAIYGMLKEECRWV